MFIFVYMHLYTVLIYNNNNGRGGGMGEKVTRGQSTNSETFGGGETIGKNVLLVSKTTLHHVL